VTTQREKHVIPNEKESPIAAVSRVLSRETSIVPSNVLAMMLIEAVRETTPPSREVTIGMLSVFAMIKAKFGGSVLSRNPVAQINEVLAKCGAHNLCCVVKAIFTAGLAPTFWPDAGSAS
jgi:hypothetical protein